MTWEGVEPSGYLWEGIAENLPGINIVDIHNLVAST